MIVRRSWRFKVTMIAKMMQQVKAYYNWLSGWIWDCPKCNDKPYDGTKPNISEKAGKGKPGICSRCYPGIHAMMQANYEGRLVQVPDLSARARAYAEAEKRGEIYEVVFPRNEEKIMALLRKRPRKNMNWWPGISLKELQRENIEHGVE